MNQDEVEKAMEVISRLEKRLPFTYGEVTLTGISVAEDRKNVKFVFDTGQSSCIPLHVFLELEICKNA